MPGYPLPPPVPAQKKATPSRAPRKPRSLFEREHTASAKETVAKPVGTFYTPPVTLMLELNHHVNSPNKEPQEELLFSRQVTRETSAPSHTRDHSSFGVTAKAASEA